MSQHGRAGAAAATQVEGTDVLTADGHLQRAQPGERAVVDVAVGVLIDADGRFLLTSRPAGKVYAGYWEFPGGKLESGERYPSGQVVLRR